MMPMKKMEEINFKKSAVFQMNIKPIMTWIDSLSTVGGLLGFSFTSICEENFSKKLESFLE